MNLWWVLIGVLLMLIAWKPVLLHILVFNRMRAFRLTVPSFQIIPKDETPPETVAIFGQAGAELEGLGFHFEYAAMFVPPQGEAFKAPVWIYVHDQSSVYCLIQKFQLASGTLIARCSFETILEDGRTLETNDCCYRSDNTDVQLYNPIHDLALGAHYQAHLDFVAQNGKPRALLAPEAFCAEEAKSWHRSMQFREKQGQVFRVGEACFEYSLMESVRRTFAATANLTKFQKTKAVKVAEDNQVANQADVTPVNEVEQYRQIIKASEISPLRGLTKLVLLVVSLGVFCLAFRLSFSWKTVLVLLGVLSFHEGGHLLGMWIFGYKNLKLLFLPFLGAVAIGGKKEYVAPWKELIVLFLGPLPGFFLGVAVLSFPTFQKIPVSHELGLMLVGLNLFNLIPIHPLDGGQIWDILLFRRTPLARAIFLGLCAALLFAAGFVGVFGKAFIAFGGLLLMQFPAQIRQAKLVSALRRKYGASLSAQDEDTILTSTFDYLRQNPKKHNLVAKVRFASGILAQTKADPAEAGTFLFGLATYASPLWVIVFGALLMSVHSKSVASSELAKAKAAGVLTLPVEQVSPADVDAGPTLKQMQDLLEKKDIDLKLSALHRHLSKPGFDPEQIRKEFNDSDVRAFLQLARQAANANFINAECPMELRISVASELTRWLVLAAECSALTGDDLNAWINLEASFRSVGLKSQGSSRFSSPSAEFAISTAVMGMQKVMLRRSPTAEEIARLRDLTNPRRLGRAVLRERLQGRIEMVSFDLPSRFPRNPLVRLIGLLSPPINVDPRNTLAEIQEIKQRLQKVESDPNVTADELLGKMKDSPTLAGLGVTLAQINLARTALALEEYRNVHGSLPEELKEVEGLNARPLNSILWDRQKLQLRAPSPAGDRFARPNEAIGEEGETDTTYNPFIWKIRSAS